MESVCLLSMQVSPVLQTLEVGPVIPTSYKPMLSTPTGGGSLLLQVKGIEQAC